MSEYGQEIGNPLFNRRNESFGTEEEKKLNRFIEELAAEAARILVERHYKGISNSIAAIKQKNILNMEFKSLLQADRKTLAISLLGPLENVEEAAEKLASIGERKWLKKNN
jgi:hypothetical protein